MIHGAHFLLYSADPDADRIFLRDVLEFRAVDAVTTAISLPSGGKVGLYQPKHLTALGS